MFTLPANLHLSTELTIKRSRFIATIARTDSEDAARTTIASIRSDFPGARHNCSAFVIASLVGPARTHSNDDGEPAGTAGAPILEALLAAKLTNVSAVVTRYFGGVLLGTGGLARAYGETTALAISKAPLVRRVWLEQFDVTVPAGDAGRFEAEAHRRGWKITESLWGQGLTLTIAIDKDDVSAMKQCAFEMTRGNAEICPQGPYLAEVPV